VKVKVRSMELSVVLSKILIQQNQNIANKKNHQKKNQISKQIHQKKEPVMGTFNFPINQNILFLLS
jgi:hypothetical protein